MRSLKWYKRGAAYLQLQEIGMGNLWETGEVRNYRQVTIAAVQLYFL